MKKSLLTPIYLLFLVGMFTQHACEKSPQNIDQLREVCFEAEVLPIMQNSCATTNCHDVRAEHGYRLDSYEGILKGIEAFAPNKSRLYKAIISTGEERMPPDQPLSKDARTIIRVWIEQGAENTICDDSLNIIDTTTNNPAWSNPYACFERDILPLMISSCGVSGCHDPVSREEGYNFTTYQGILKGLNPGNPGNSKIYKSVTKSESDDLMPPPPYSRLSQAQVDTIYNWILRGALDEACGELCDTVDVTYTTHLADIIDVSCTGCHSGTSPQGGVYMRNYSDLVASVNNGSMPSVLRGSNSYSMMPPFNPLSECSVRGFELWIENGMPE